MNFDAILDRILDLLVNPVKEWERIRNEDTPNLQLLQQYLLNRIIPVIILNAGAYFVGVTFIGARNKDLIEGSRLLSPIIALIASLLLVAAYIGIIILGGLIIKLIATSFESEINEFNSFKLAAFSLYPLLLLGSLHIIPGIKIGTFAGAYGIYLLYKGLPILLNTPPEKAASYTLVVSLAIIGMLALEFSLINTITNAAPLLRIGL